jgi:hypothetical protein
LIAPFVKFLILLKAATAQLPVPHARVIPIPLSHVLSSILFSSITLAKLKLASLGNKLGIFSSSTTS